MFWIDLCIDRLLTGAEIQSAWATVFGIPTDSVAVIAEWEELLGGAEPPCPITAARSTPHYQHFPMLLSMIVRDAALEAMVEPDAATVDAAQRFCATIGCGALLSVDLDQSVSVVVTPTELFRVYGYEPDEDDITEFPLEPIEGEFVRREGLHGETYTVNGRTYLQALNGRLYPISGDGIHNLNKSAFLALGCYNERGASEQTEAILDAIPIDPDDRATARELWERAHARRDEES